MRVLALILLLFFAGCSSSSSAAQYKVAIDPGFNSLDLPERAGNIRAFCIELIEEIGKIEETKIAIYEVNWDALLWSIQQGQSNGIISTMQPYLFYEKIYSFSDPLLLTGPTLVIPVGLSVSSLKDMEGKEIAVIRGSKDALILEKYPEIIQRTYDSVPAALNDVATGVIDGAMIDILTASAYCKDLYQGTLKTALAPLSQEGLRLVTMQGGSPGLIEKLNAGLHKMKKNDAYDKLTKKWGLG